MLYKILGIVTKQGPLMPRMSLYSLVVKYTLF